MPNQETSLPYYLPISGGRILGFIPFPRVLELQEMQSTLSRIWTRITVSIWYDDSPYTTGTSNLFMIKSWNVTKRGLFFVKVPFIVTYFFHRCYSVWISLVPKIINNRYNVIIQLFSRTPYMNIYIYIYLFLFFFLFLLVVGRSVKGSIF